jgi:exodeoxyribonuclease VII large subunit
LHRFLTLQHKLSAATAKALANSRHRLNIAVRALNAVSPLATLDRGYAIVTDAKSGRVLTNAAQAKAGDPIGARLSKGTISATVTGIANPSSD